MTDGRRSVYSALGRIAWQTGANTTTPLPGGDAGGAAVTFELGFTLGEDPPWSSAATLELTPDDGGAPLSAAAESTSTGALRYRVPGVRPGVAYRGALREGDALEPLFGPVVLAALYEAGAALHLPPPPPADEPPAPFEPGDLADFLIDEPETVGALDPAALDPNDWT